MKAWGFSSVVEFFPGEHKVLGFISSTENHHQQESSELEDKVEEIHIVFKSIKKNIAKPRNMSKTQLKEEDEAMCRDV